MDSSKLGIEKFDGFDFFRGEVGIHDRGEVETQGSPGSRVDSVDFVKKHGVEHREGEDYVRSVEGTVKHV